MITLPMTTLRAKSAAVVEVAGKPYLRIVLVGGNAVEFPLARVKSFTPARIRAAGERVQDVRVEDRGLTIAWPSISVDFSVPEMVPHYLGIATVSAVAQRAGRVKSAAKTAAARANGAKGGRPRKAA